jgi:hypothetical protein
MADCVFMQITIEFCTLNLYPIKDQEIISKPYGDFAFIAGKFNWFHIIKYDKFHL